MAKCNEMSLKQALTIAALVLEFEAESTDRQQAPNWAQECTQAAQLLKRAKAVLHPSE